MAWHVLHGLLEQVRIQSTFPGKLWIVTMFIFRIVVVARIGEMVYEDEQHSFICNTLTPGCSNVCFNRFSPISQLRYWSLMVLVVSTPSILFFLYAMHIIYHADIKYGGHEEENDKAHPVSGSNELAYLHPPSLKRPRDSSNVPNGGAPPLYEVTRLPSYKTSKMAGKDARRRRIAKRQNSNRDEGIKAALGSRIGSNTDNNELVSEEDVAVDYRRKYPIYDNGRSHRIQYMKGQGRTTVEMDAMEERKFKRKMLQHPELYRAYWWHVVLRLALEVGCLVGQYYLYGFNVKELYECTNWPCPKTVDCFVSRPQEKSCLLWLMYGLGAIATLLSLAEFWSLGIKKAALLCTCCTDDETEEERRKRLALLEHHHHQKQHDAHANGGIPIKRLTSVVSLDSLSSETSVESV